MGGHRANGPARGTTNTEVVMRGKGNPVRQRIERGIYKRTTRDGQPRYEVAYLDSDGRQRWRTVARLQEARELRATLVAKVKSGERVVPSRAPLAEYTATWLDKQEPRLRPKTFDLYESYLRLYILPRLGKRRLQSITVEDVAALIASMQKGVRYKTEDGRLAQIGGKPFSAWTIRGVLVVLGRVLGSAVREGVVASNAVRRLERDEKPAVQRRTFPSLDIAAIGSLISHTPERYRTLVAVSVLTGIRQSEALGLRWQDVDTKTGVLRVRFQLDRKFNLVEPKTEAARREIPIPPSLVRMLMTHKAKAFERGCAKPSDFVFASETGGPLHHRNVSRRGLKKAIAPSGLPHLTWHDLRHVAASVMISQGASVAYLSRILGHASPSITLSIYAHQFDEAAHADRTRDQMEAAFGSLL
jgi:integrase